MDRTKGQNYTTSGGKCQFTDGPPGTCVDADWLNSVQEEIIYVIQMAGLTPDTNSRNQLATAIEIIRRKVLGITL